MKSLLFRFLVLLAFSTQVFAQSEEKKELFTRYEHYYTTYDVNQDASYVETHNWAMKILKESVVANAKKTSISYSTSIQKAEVLEAYTRKADGRRIDSPKSNFQVEVNSGREKDAPIFSDMTTLTVVFPDVAVGDTVVFSYKITQIEPMFPKQFAVIETYPKTWAYDDVRVKIDIPSSLLAQYDTREMQETVSEKEGRKIFEWTWSNKEPIKSKRKDYSVYDIEGEPGLTFSTFKSYAEIAEAYGARARSKAVVTERVQKLADEIVKDKKTPREQAKALYEWVAINISYEGNCIGVGAVVPHDIDFILDNKIGDCKDHATLLQALLTAKGIVSTQALINSGSSYRLSKIPTVFMVNHVINYIPSLDQYADSTSQITPFGMLPFYVSDKPVLWVDGFKEGVKTPVLPIGANQQRMKTMAKIDSNGSIAGDIEIDLKGDYAANSRAQFRHIPKEAEDELVKYVLKGQGYIGDGKLDKKDPTDLADTYKYGVKFDVKEFVQRPGAGAFKIQPLFFSEASIQRFLQVALESEEPVEFACSSGTSTEEYVYQFPKNMKILSIPENVTITDEFLSYRATYRLKNGMLTVTRMLNDKTPGNVCQTSTFRLYKRFASKVLQDTKAQVVYK